MLLLKLVCQGPPRFVGNVDVVVDVVVEVGAVKAYRACQKMLTSSLMLLLLKLVLSRTYRACKKMLTSSLMLLLKLVLSRPTALVRKC